MKDSHQVLVVARANSKLGILGLVVFAYVVFVPIIPFHYFYNVDLNNP